jgi:hypothetical protein
MTSARGFAPIGWFDGNKAAQLVSYPFEPTNKMDNRSQAAESRCITSNAKLTNDVSDGVVGRGMNRRDW